MNVFIGGLIGCMCGGYITQYSHPRYAFLIYSTMGLMVSINALFLTSESEGVIDDNEDVQKDTSFCKATKATYRKIK